MTEPSPQDGDGPQTGDSVVDQAIEAFRATQHQHLGQRAEAAVRAQHALQERLAESALGTGSGPETDGATSRPPSA